MSTQPGPCVPSCKKASNDHEFEWLLCVASTFQACHNSPTPESDAAIRSCRPKPSRSRVTGWTHVNPGILIRGAVSSWHRMRSKHRNAA